MKHPKFIYLYFKWLYLILPLGLIVCYILSDFTQSGFAWTIIITMSLMSVWCFYILHQSKRWDEYPKTKRDI